MSKKEHPYAQLLRWIADGETVEMQLLPYSANVWQVVTNSGLLKVIGDGGILPLEQYRLKPRTIRIGEFDVPEPMRRAPFIGSVFFLALTAQPILSGEHTWQGSGGNFEWLDCGLCHATREAAEAHARALLSFTTQEAA